MLASPMGDSFDIAAVPVQDDRTVVIGVMPLLA